MTNEVELSRVIKIRHLPASPVKVIAGPDECSALAVRFGVTAIHSLAATVELDTVGSAITAAGTLLAEIEQPCAITSENFRYHLTDELALRFVPASAIVTPTDDEEIELDSNAPDEIEYEGETIDLGEAIAQSFALAIDPCREGPDAPTVRDAGLVSSEEAVGPFASLAALKKS